ncbi:MAG: hypothetical protein Q8K32_01595 [Archangium sp.]|nr:hypothetical protein [Archangium sp.]
MFSGLVVTLVVLGAPVQVPEVTSAETVKQFMGGQVTVVGQLERVPLGKGNSSWAGTGLVLDDDTIIYLSYSAPPPGWEALIGARLRVEGTLRPSLSEHEQSLIAPHLREPGKPTKEARSLAKLMGNRVRISGIAQDAKGGAVLMIDKAPFYLEGLSSWPAEVRGKAVAVGGKLVDKQYLPKASGPMEQRGETAFRDAKGMISQGAEATQNVIEAPTWRALKEPK